jgi:hypothetical protein
VALVKEEDVALEEWLGYVFPTGKATWTRRSSSTAVPTPTKDI